MTSKSDPDQWQTIPVDARYTRRNADRAMSGYIVRGLVELITNARDSGRRMEQRGEASREDLLGRPVELIQTVKKGGECNFVVRDRFEGMNATTMRDRLLRYGHITSDFDSVEGVRGLNARGAKDAGMLGEVRFESICDGVLTTCKVRLGEFTDPSSTSATREDRARLHIIEGNGTVVTLSPFPDVSIPKFGPLTGDLERHIEIRYRPNRIGAIPLDMSERKPKGQGKECRILGFAPEGDLLLDQFVEISGYTEFPDKARLIIRKSAESLRVSGRSLIRLWRSEAGILVGDGRTAHDISFFGAAGASEAGASHLFGTLEVPQIADLLKRFEEYEEQRAKDHTLSPDPSNPSQVTDPDRLGLNQEHPFVIALTDSVRPLVEKALAQIEEELRPPAGDRVDEKLRALLEKLGEELAEKLEIEGGAERGRQIPMGLSFVPPSIRTVIGHTKRAGIYYRASDHLTESETCQLSTESGAIELAQGSVELEPDPDTGVLRGYVEIKGVALTGTALVEGKASGENTVLRVSVRDEVPDPEIELDRDLQFSRSRYTSVPGRKKVIDVYGDPTLEGRSVVMTIDGDKVRPSWATLEFVFDSELGVCKARFTAECDEEASEELLAACSDLEDSSRIVYRDLKGKPRINFEFVDEPSFGRVRRFKWEVAQNRVIIAAKHPTIARVLGPDLDPQSGGKWPGQHSPQARAVLAELVAEAFVDRKMQKELPTMAMGPDNLVDPVDYEEQRYSFFDEVLTICHKVLTPPYSK